MNTNAAVDSTISTLMTQVQVCASAYALIGSRFDRGHERENFETEMADIRNMLDSALSTAAQPQADAYQGAREDLAIWKRRALEAESALRTEQEASSRLAAEVNGPTHLGEPC